MAEGSHDASSPLLKKPRLMQYRNSTDLRTEPKAYETISSPSTKQLIPRRRMTDGTSQKELDRAKELYLNRTSPTQY